MPETSLADIITNITARRWLAIRRAMDATLEEITEDPISLMVVACNERHRDAHGSDAWAKYLDMTLTELTAELGLGNDEPKSDAAA